MTKVNGNSNNMGRMTGKRSSWRKLHIAVELSLSTVTPAKVSLRCLAMVFMTLLGDLLKQGRFEYALIVLGEGTFADQI